MSEKNALAFKEAKTGRGKRVLQRRAPKEVENVRRLMVLKGRRASQVVQDALTDIGEGTLDSPLRRGHLAVSARAGQ